MTDHIEELGEGMSSPVSQRECDTRFEVVKEIRQDVRDLSGKTDDIKTLVGNLSTDISTMNTVQQGHLKAHEKSSRSFSTWFAIVIALLVGASALVFGILNHN